jgi:MerR family Zn(II)-responsive transcriptional regulator of zntA
MLTIGKLASLTDVSNDTLRYYEHEGLLTPTGKSAAGYRLYDGDSVKRIRFIKHAQQCGFTLSQIRELLVLRSRDAACCGDVRRRAIEKKLQIETKIRAMKAMSKALDQLIADCANEKKPVRECSIIAALERANMADRGTTLLGKHRSREPQG